MLTGYAPRPSWSLPHLPWAPCVALFTSWYHMAVCLSVGLCTLIGQSPDWSMLSEAKAVSFVSHVSAVSPVALKE